MAITKPTRGRCLWSRSPRGASVQLRHPRWVTMARLRPDVEERWAPGGSAGSPTRNADPLSISFVRALGPETAQQVPYRRSAHKRSPTWAQPRRRIQTGEKEGAGRVAGALSGVAATVARRPLALPLRGGGAAAPGSDVQTSNGRSLRRRSLRPSQTAQWVHAIPDDHSGHSWSMASWLPY